MHRLLNPSQAEAIARQLVKPSPTKRYVAIAITGVLVLLGIALTFNESLSSDIVNATDLELDFALNRPETQPLPSDSDVDRLVDARLHRLLASGQRLSPREQQAWRRQEREKVLNVQRSPPLSLRLGPEGMRKVARVGLGMHCVALAVLAWGCFSLSLTPWSLLATIVLLSTAVQGVAHAAWMHLGVLIVLLFKTWLTVAAAGMAGFYSVGACCLRQPAPARLRQPHRACAELYFKERRTLGLGFRDPDQASFDHALLAALAIIPGVGIFLTRHMKAKLEKRG